MFVLKYHDRIDWKALEAFVESTRTTAIYQILNGICVDYLGFSPEVFPAGRHPLESRVLETSSARNSPPLSHLHPLPMALEPPPLAPPHLEAEASLSGVFGADFLCAVGDAFDASGGIEAVDAIVVFKGRDVF